MRTYNEDTQKFQSTPPVWGATVLRIDNILAVQISIHAPPCGGRHALLSKIKNYGKFQSTPPCGGRRAVAGIIFVALGISIHAPRAGGTTDKLNLGYQRIMISIHAPRAGGDPPPAPPLPPIMQTPPANKKCRKIHSCTLRHSKRPDLNRDNGFPRMLRLHHYSLCRLYHSLRTLATIAFSSVVRFAYPFALSFSLWLYPWCVCGFFPS